MKIYRNLPSLRRFSTAQKKADSMPEFFQYYGKLLNNSRIMERILPREVDAESLRNNFPFLFTNSEITEFRASDV